MTEEKEHPLRIKARKLLVSSDYEWHDNPDGTLTLSLLSQNSRMWTQHTLTAEACTCAAVGPCYHQHFLGLFGGPAGVRHYLERERNRGKCIRCGCEIPTAVWCDECKAIEIAIDFGGKIEKRRRGEK